MKDRPRLKQESKYTGISGSAYMIPRILVSELDVFWLPISICAPFYPKIYSMGD
jgi:hypothetical protein